MNRKAEIRELLNLSENEVVSRAGRALRVFDTLDELHRSFAVMLADEAAMARAAGEVRNFIVPVGPTGGYPHLVEMVAAGECDLSSCRWFFMDEYCDDAGNTVPPTHPLSFKRTMNEMFFEPLHQSSADARLPAEVVFPDESNIGALAQRITEAGGITTCYGGIGIHGHVAFNEPEPGVAVSEPRRVALNDFTVTINAVRAGVGGNLEGFPREAYTLGMAQILAADRIVLFCRNGTEFDWANTVLRLALFGEPGDDYPVTHIRNREYMIVTDRDTLSTPVNLL